MEPAIYLDYNATTPMDPRVWKAMEPFFTERFGNPASLTHAYGWDAENVVEESRKKIATLIGARDPRSILFTSGATESNNLAIKGIAWASKSPIHGITQKTEHKCILEACKAIEECGHSVTYLDVDADGKVNPAAVQSAIRPNTRFISIMAANNEIGTLQPIQEIAKSAHSKNILFHTDTAQAVGKIPMNVEKMGIDLMSLSAHKIYGPKGIGALYIRNPQLPLTPLLHGGGHERGYRSGTLNVPGIVGFATALELCIQEMHQESKRLTLLRDSLLQKLQVLPGLYLNGHPTDRLPNNLNVSIDYVRADELIPLVPLIALSSGSACTSGTPEPSYVVAALGGDKNRVKNSIRIGLGRWTRPEDIDKAASVIINAVHKLRKKSLEYEMNYVRKN